MRVLWVGNIMLPVIAEALHREASNKEGWLSGLLSQIVAWEDTGSMILQTHSTFINQILF